MRSRIGGTLSLHCTAIGKAILAALPEDDVRGIAHRTGLPRRMPRTLITADALLANLATVRARGWALDDEENNTRVRCVGAVVLDHRGEPIGAVSVSGLSVDLARVQVARLAPMVVQTARAVSRALGARR
jgi:DNA-binding IclR family transcriptional regulator